MRIIDILLCTHFMMGIGSPFTLEYVKIQIEGTKKVKLES